MSELQVVTTGYFEDIQCEIYSQNDEMYMTINQLAKALGYADRKGIEKMVERNPYLKESEFSVTDKLSATDGKRYQTRLFTEDGVYEVSFLSSASNAMVFRAWVRKLIKAYRQGQLQAIQSAMKWQEVRHQSKLTRKSETDALQAFVEYAKAQGSTHADRYYTIFSKLVNDAVGLKTGDRENAPYKVLRMVELLEEIVMGTIVEQMEQNVFYKEIYVSCKEKVKEVTRFLPTQSTIYNKDSCKKDSSRTLKKSSC